MDLDSRIALFQELIRCGNEVYTWVYGADGALLCSNCPDEALFAAAFSVFGMREKMFSHARQHSSPLTLGTEFGMVWGAAFEKEDGFLRRAYVIGPVFYSSLPIQTIQQGLYAYHGLELGMVWKHRFLEALHIVPAVPYTLFARYLMMLHYSITGEHIGVCDLHLPPPSEAAQQSSATNDALRDRQMIYMSERAMLQMVRNGDLNYQQALGTSILISNGVPIHSTDPLRQAKTSITVFCTLVTRAAIEGGLSPEESYALGDSYIQAAEDAADFSELTHIPLEMYDDFVRRVHKRRTNPKRSPQIQKCCDYIEMHLEERIRADVLAKLVGYSEYYITRKFKAETGFSIADYSKLARIERAKVLLTNASLSIPQVSEQLGFATQSYFGQTFKQVTGMTPGEYRASKGL